MRHPPLRPLRSHGAGQVVSCVTLPAGLQEQVLSASLMLASASSRVSPWLIAPGISTHWTVKPPSSRGSSTTVYFILLHYFQRLYIFSGRATGPPEYVTAVRGICQPGVARIIRCSAVTSPTSANIAAIGQSRVSVCPMISETRASSASARSVTVRCT